LATPLTVPGTITPATLTLTGESVTKVYDSTTSTSGATITGTPVLSGVFAADTGNVSVSGLTLGVYNSANVLTAATVTVTGGTLSGSAASNYKLATPLTVPGTITPATLTLTGESVTKVYDSTTSTSGATITGTPVLSGVFAADTGNVSVSGLTLGVYNSANVLTAATVTVTGGTLSGSAASNYKLATPLTVPGTITPATLTLTGESVTKVYDSTTSTSGATITGTPVLSGVFAADTGNVSVSGLTLGVYNSANVLTAATVTVTGGTLSGSAASNYKLATPLTVPGTITPATLTLTGESVTKVYDSTTSTSGATITGTPVLSGVFAADTGNVSVSGLTLGTYNSANVASATTVSVTGGTLSGSAASNYKLATPLTVPGTITPATLTLTGESVTKVYDSTTSTSGATITGTPVLSGVFAADTGNVSVSGLTLGVYN